MWITLWITLRNHYIFLFIIGLEGLKSMQKAEMNELLVKAKELLKAEVTGISYNTWIRDMEIQSIENNVITILTATKMQKESLEARYLDLIKNTFAFITNIDYTIKVISEEDLKETSNSSNYTKEFSYQQGNLNAKYTFDSFVVGNSNRFAHAAALAVAEAPATAYNPLFLYGGVGLGKTHLMHAIGNEILKHNKSANVLYITSEKFTNQLIDAITKNNTEEFRNKYRNIDVLLIDDIQFIAGKKSTQEEFFHTFNALHESGKQIILSSDRPPKDIQPLEDRLRTRFEWGLIADISDPDYETRLAILRKKAQLENIIIDDEILSNIATKIDSNIRELEGTLNKIVAHSSLTNSPITMELSNKAINDVVAHKEKVLSLEYIQDVVAKYFNITIEDLKGSRRSNDVAFPRQVAMYLCRNVAQISLPKIGAGFGKRDHSTVMHACKKIEDDIKTDSNTKLIVETVKNSLFEN